MGKWKYPLKRVKDFTDANERQMYIVDYFVERFEAGMAEKDVAEKLRKYITKGYIPISDMLVIYTALQLKKNG